MSCFCVDRCLLGTEHHLVVNDGVDDVRWAKRVPRDMWHLSGVLKPNDDWCLDTLLQISGLTVDLSPPQRFINSLAISERLAKQPRIPWQQLMPVQEHREFIRRVVADVLVVMPRTLESLFRGPWCSGNAILRALEPACVDREAWQKLEDEGLGNVVATHSFEPDEEGYARPVAYDRFRTVTGRLTVASGPQILTLKKEHRSIIRSRYGDQGSVVALDFAALEARVLLYEHGGSCDDADLYEAIAREVGRDRKCVKGAVLAELYGMNKWALGKKLGIDGVDLIDFIRGVKQYFRTDELLARVKKQFIKTGKITNRYGRPIIVDEPLDHLFINYYAQATGVDVTMLGFKLVLDLLALKAPGTVPIFLLHDAMLLDVPNEELAFVQRIKRIKVPGYVQRYYLRCEPI